MAVVVVGMIIIIMEEEAGDAKVGGAEAEVGMMVVVATNNQGEMAAEAVVATMTSRVETAEEEAEAMITREETARTQSPQTNPTRKEGVTPIISRFRERPCFHRLKLKLDNVSSDSDYYGTP